jgi:hypothetical protein
VLGVLTLKRVQLSLVEDRVRAENTQGNRADHFRGGRIGRLTKFIGRAWLPGPRQIHDSTIITILLYRRTLSVVQAFILG